MAFRNGPYGSRRNRSRAMLVSALANNGKRPKPVRLFNSADYCEWFALCPNHCTKMRSHPTLGQVPICDRCDKKVEELSI